MENVRSLGVSVQLMINRMALQYNPHCITNQCGCNNLNLVNTDAVEEYKRHDMGNAIREILYSLVRTKSKIFMLEVASEHIKKRLIERERRLL